MGDVKWELRLGDCLDPVTGMASLADKSVDHVITDPPYSANLYARTRTNKGSGIRKTGTPYAKTELQEQTSAMQLASSRIGAIDDILSPAAAEMLRLSCRWIIVFHDAEIWHRWIEAMGQAYVRAGCWAKTDPMPQVSGDRPAHGFEACSIGHRPGRKRWNGGGHAALWIGGTCKGEERPDHPSPKPLWLMEALVRDFTDPGDLILDPFAGSGTTGVAAIRLGRRFIGWERDPKYHAIAVKRLTAAREQLDMWEMAR